MSKAKVFGLVLGVILGAATMAKASTSPSKISDELYSEDLYRSHSENEIPQSLESNSRENPLAEADIDAAPAIESVADLNATPTKKSGKKSKKQVSF